MRNLFSLLIPLAFLVNTSNCQESSKKYDHQLALDLSGGATTQLNLRFKVGDVYGIKYTVRNSAKRVRLSFGASMGNYRTKTHKRYKSYNPQSDTLTVLHWNHVLYEFEILMDFIIKETEKSKLYFSLGWNAGSYVERIRTSKTYDESQNDKLISEDAQELGQPLESILFGRGIGLGYERIISKSWSFSIVPNIKYKSNFGPIGLEPLVFIGIDVGLQLNL